MKTYILRDPQPVEPQKSIRPPRAQPAAPVTVKGPVLFVGLDVQSRAATALRLAAQSLNKAQNYFGDLYRRWKARLGSPKAITAMAHKLARVLRHLLKYKVAFNPDVFAKEEEKMKRKKLARLQNMAATLNYQLIPNP